MSPFSWAAGKYSSSLRPQGVPGSNSYWDSSAECVIDVTLTGNVHCAHEVLCSSYMQKAGAGGGLSSTCDAVKHCVVCEQIIFVALSLLFVLYT